eukprot:TRINITY_DN67110_c9_g5_i1.p1 TRINITY_DN67110_c9_g5~~TRINITY_DN67110_c9_g5_i1.p1  ORF type:complete len:255 (-),score=26.31 TRINITY_DN67110_c9_g5_i1:769-1533(-)
MDVHTFVNWITNQFDDKKKLHTRELAQPFIVHPIGHTSLSSARVIKANMTCIPLKHEGFRLYVPQRNTDSWVLLYRERTATGADIESLDTKIGPANEWEKCNWNPNPHFVFWCKKGSDDFFAVGPEVTPDSMDKNDISGLARQLVQLRLPEEKVQGILQGVMDANPSNVHDIGVCLTTLGTKRHDHPTVDDESVFGAIKEKLMVCLGQAGFSEAAAGEFVGFVCVAPVDSVCSLGNTLRSTACFKQQEEQAQAE